MSLQFGSGSVLLRGAARPANVIPDSGLLHEWRVSDNTSPLTNFAGSNDLSVVAGTFDDATATWKDGWAFDGDGVDDVAEGSNVATDTFTLCWWAYPRDTSTQFIAYNGDGGAANPWPGVRINSSGDWQIGIGGTGTYTSVMGNAVQTNALTLVTARYDGSTLSLVENTTETGTASTSQTQSTGGSFTVNARIDGAGGYEFHADNIADWGLFYNEWKTDSEIQQIYDAHPST